jgi:hypothetical protein
MNVRLTPEEIRDGILANVRPGESHLVVGSLAPIPPIVCLCGSTKFKHEFELARREETHAGKIVLTVGSYPHADHATSPENFLGQELKTSLDELHKRKIDLADEVLVIDVDGYVGLSTRGEIEHATLTGKPIRYWTVERERSAKLQEA